MSDLRTRLRRRAGTIMVGGAGLLLAASVGTLALPMLGGNSAAAEADAQEAIAELRTQADEAEDELATKHEQLLAKLPGADVERVARDRATGRGLLLTLTGTSSSTRSVAETQALLDARYKVLGPDSRALTEFVPEWMSATGAAQGSGTVYRISDLSIDVGGISGLDYSYVGVARLDPVVLDEDEAGPSEFVLLSFSTAQDGTVTRLDVYRTETKSRDALLDEGSDKKRTGG